jgi:maltooligosyltrehalose synthase
MLDELLPSIDRAEWLRSSSVGGRDRGADSLEAYVAAMLADWPDARVKMFLTAAGLRLRNREHRLVVHGDYVPLAADGIGATHLIAFARCSGSKALLAVVPRLTCQLLPVDRHLPIGPSVWGDTRITLPRGLAGQTFRHVFTGQQITSARLGGADGLRVADALRTLPVALLWSDR